MVSMWAPTVECPFPEDEDPAQTAWWRGLDPSYQARWAPLLARLEPRGRAFFHRLRRERRETFRAAEGTPERAAEEDAAEEELFARVGTGVARSAAAVAGDTAP